MGFDLSALSALVDRGKTRPLDWIQWLPGQAAFLKDPSSRKLARWGNQWGGKTTTGLAEIIYRCLGEHPYFDVPPAPVECWVITASWDQSLAVQKKLAELVPKTAIDPRCVFDPVKGWRGKWPVIRFLNGSMIRIKTTRQGGLRLSAATIDCALFDEPPESPRIYSEIQKRVMRRNGAVLLTLTPINAPVDWLQELVSAGQIADHHYRLTPENLIPVGASEPLRLDDGTPMDQEWIDRIIAETLPHERPVVLDGEWECRTQDRVFTAFNPDVHISAEPPRGRMQICLGIDHGDGAEFSQSAILVAIDNSQRDERIHVLDEYASDGSTTSDMDAAAIIDMLRRHGLSWRSVDRAYGDRVYSGRRDGISKKSNEDLIQCIGRIVGIPGPKLYPQIKTVKRGKGHGRGSLDQGCRYLHQAMVRPGCFTVSPRCVRLIESIDRWNFSTWSEWKHAIDALRYSLDGYIFSRQRRPVAKLRLHG